VDRGEAFSDEYLNALVDGQLGCVEQDRVYRVLDRSPALRMRLCALRDLKAMVRHAYPEALCRMAPTQPRTRPRLPSRHALAASLLFLAAGGAGGWLAHGCAPAAPGGQLAGLFRTMQRNDLDLEPARYVVHVDTANPVRLKTALDETERLLAGPTRTGRQPRVEVIANGPGLDLLRAGVSPYAARIAMLERKYPNLDFTACGRTIRRLQQQGVEVQLLPHTKVTTSALDEIIARHLEQHWAYIKV
jgi:intracellular sulfur oxidation DsrE/DsrF family protein